MLNTLSSNSLTSIAFVDLKLCASVDSAFLHCFQPYMALQYVTTLASITLIFDCINPINSNHYYVLWAPIARYDP